MYLENRAINETLQHFSTTFYQVLAKHKQRNIDRLLYRTVLRKLFLDMQRNVSVIADKRAKLRTKGIPVVPIMQDPRSAEELLADKPQEWFEKFIESEQGYKQFKPEYDALSDAKKAQLSQIFESSREDVMENKQMFTSWLSEKVTSGDTETLLNCQTAFIAFMSENSSSGAHI